MAPTQVVIVPITSADSNFESFVSEIEKLVRGSGFRVLVDKNDNYTPGYKFNQWEMKGVPLRMEKMEKHYSTLRKVSKDMMEIRKKLPLVL